MFRCCAEAISGSSTCWVLLTRKGRRSACRSILLEVRKNGVRARRAAVDAGAAGDHLFVRGKAETAVALSGTNLVAGEAKGFKPAMDRTKTFVHGLGSCDSSQDTADIAMQHRFRNASRRDAAMRKSHRLIHKLFNFG
ncbi:hypothetical protein RL1450 [Rhizobium johnstonii 3841]|uniref:Uncharacterized protein n=1 Tax=Rhizobium johnstonii (strain DSM 114642 / LMG 32736 / 3841) TaxID=216596 RepID=Q1MJB5_RHIJ3|nr:hypothetical protein RL1450 [Rhizobium johnstonii 3841]